MRTTPAEDIEQVLLVSHTFRDGPVASLDDAAGQLEAVSGLSERIVLHTCHRAELIGLLPSAAQPAPTTDLPQLRGLPAVERWMLVVGGLDSAVLAEEQLLGQVRQAYARALEQRQTGPILNELLRRAIGFGRYVRSASQPGADRSLADPAAAWVAERLNGRASGRRALVLGAGEMGRELASRFARLGLSVTIASRSEERAAEILGALPASGTHRTLHTNDALERLGEHELVAIAARGHGVTIDERRLGEHRPLVVDLSAPPIITPSGRAVLGDRLLDLDSPALLQQKRTHAAVERRLRARASEEAERFAAWLRDRSGASGAALLSRHAEEIRQRHVARLQRRAMLSPEQTAEVEAATSAMVGELLHRPMVALRSEDDAEAVIGRVFGTGS